MTMDPGAARARGGARGPDPDDPELRLFHGRDATPSDSSTVSQHPPREVLEVVRCLLVAAGLQAVLAIGIGLLTASRFGSVPGIVTGALLAVSAATSLVAAWRLRLGSDRARRFVAWPLEDDSWLFASTSWVRTRLRTQRAERWFAEMRRQRERRGAARRTGGPR